VAKSAELKKRGVDAVYVISVNDAAVMSAWAQDQQIDGSLVTFLADARSEATDILGLYTEAGKLGNKRGGRYSILVEDGKVVSMNVCEGDVPASESFVGKMLADLDKLKK
jgi:peroxiredoxin